MTCRRCGLQTIRFTVDQRYCSRCEVDVKAALAPKPRPSFVPVWMRQPFPKVLA